MVPFTTKVNSCNVRDFTNVQLSNINYNKSIRTVIIKLQKVILHGNWIYASKLRCFVMPSVHSWSHIIVHRLSIIFHLATISRRSRTWNIFQLIVSEKLDFRMYMLVIVTAGPLEQKRNVIAHDFYCKKVFI